MHSPARMMRALPRIALPRFARTGPKFRIELRFCALCQKIGVCICLQHGEDRGTRAGHQCSNHFWLLEQPHFQLRQKNKFFENGALQIVR